MSVMHADMKKERKIRIVMDMLFINLLLHPAPPKRVAILRLSQIAIFCYDKTSLFLYIPYLEYIMSSRKCQYLKQ